VGGGVGGGFQFSVGMMEWLDKRDIVCMQEQMVGMFLMKGSMDEV
jgi:hypothetical protein